MNFAQCIQEFSGEYGLFLSLLMAGLVAGVTHCSAMCGPFVLSQSAGYGDQSRIERLRGTLLIPYHLGRLTTYVAMAVLFHSFFNLALLFGGAKHILSAVMLSGAALIFIVNVFPTLARAFPALMRIQLPVPYKLINFFAAPLMRDMNALKRYSLGVLLGFMPCGMVVAAIMAASMAETNAQAALAMAAYGLGTVPALVGVAAGGQALQARFPRSREWVRSGAGIVSVVWLCLLAGMMMVQ